MAAGGLETFAAAYLGVDTESAPNKIRAGYAQSVENCLTGIPGRLPLRGGLTPALALPAARKRGWASRNGSLLLAGSTTALSKVDSSFALSVVTASDADHVPGVPYAQVGDVVYGIGNTGFVLRWEDGPGTITKYANAPTAGNDLAYWLNRLWFLGTDRLKWSDQVDGGTALPDTAAAWQDDVSGLDNQILLETISGSNTARGLGVLPSALLVFGANSVDMLVGSAPSNVALRPHVSSHGCVDRRTIVRYGDAILWLAPEGFFAFDGAQEVELSAQIRGALVNNTSPSGGASAVLLDRDYVMLSLNDTFGPSTQWLLHLPTRSWSKFSSAVFTTTTCYVGRQGASGARGFICDVSHGIWSLDNVTRPHASVDTQVDSSGVAFTASVLTRVAELAGPTQRAKVSRLIVDAVLRSTNTASATLEDALGNDLASAVSLSHDAPIGYRTRTVQEVFGEADGVCVDISVVASSTSAAEIHDAYLEFSPTQRASLH